jgi:hypothetical protein
MVVAAALEVAFYPKFKNQNEKGSLVEERDGFSQTSVGFEEKMKDGDHVVVVSVKHSGSLGMNSGAQFNAKNSVQNHFTRVHETMARQYFTSLCDGDESAAQQKWLKFSGESQRLCIGAEVVSCATGDHGARANHNYFVVTSVADLDASEEDQRFWDPFKIMEFCTRHQLPSTEQFVFYTNESFKNFCGLYDSQFIHGTDSTFMKPISEMADECFQPVKHSFVQGEIIEGMVVSLFRLREGVNTQISDCARTAEAFRPTMEKAIKESSDAFEHVWKMESHEDEDMFATNVRGANDQFFHGSDGHRRDRRRLGKDDSLALVKGFIESVAGAGPHNSGDQTTKNVAKLFELCIPLAIQFHAYEIQEGLCAVIIHGINDGAFAQFRIKSAEMPDIMRLYRGHCVVISTSESGSVVLRSMYGKVPHAREAIFSRKNCTCEGRFKSKFAEYIKRTFIMRKGAGLFGKEKTMSGGLMRYQENMKHYFNQWGITESGEKTGRDYLRGWGFYVANLVSENPLVGERFREGLYLDHVENYDRQVSVHGFPNPAPFQGIVLVLYRETSVPEDGPHAKIAEFLGVETVTDLGLLGLNPKRFAMSSVVVPVPVYSQSPPAMLNKAIAGIAPLVVAIKVANSDPIETFKDGPKRKAQAMLKKWDTIQFDSFKTMEGIPLDVHKDAIRKNILEMFLSRDRKDLPERSRVFVVVFPGIPGCGKTAFGSKSMQTEILAQTGFDSIVMDGDDPAYARGFWARVNSVADGVPMFGKKVLIMCTKNCPPSIEGRGHLNMVHHEGIAARAPEGTHVMVMAPYSKGTDTNPFDHHALALCMSRVFFRKDHPNLSGPHSPGVITMFHQLYQGFTRDGLEKNWRNIFGENAIVDFPLVRPDVGDDTPLPGDLKALLGEGIEIQKEISVEKIEKEGGGLGGQRGGGRSRNQQFRPSQELETRQNEWCTKIAVQLNTHRGTIESWAPSLEQAHAVVLGNLVKVLSTPEERLVVQALEPNGPTKTHASFVAAAIDNPTHIESIFEGFVPRGMFGLRLPDGVSMQESLHITLHHRNSGPFPDELLACVNEPVDIFVEGVWVRKDLTLGSLRVTEVVSSKSGQTVPCTNSIIHLTAFKNKGTAAKDSNDLPEECVQGTADYHSLSQQLTLKGVIRAFK